MDAWGATPRARVFAHTRVTLVHALVGTVWILSSDRVLALANLGVEELNMLQTWKGMVYVVTTTVLLYLLIEHVTRTLSRNAQALHEQQRERDTLLANLPGGIYRRSAEPDGGFDFVSPGAALLFSPGSAPAAHVRFLELVHADDRALVERRVDTALRTHRSFEVSYRVHGPDGRTRWIWDQGRGVETASGARVIEGYVCDVTDHRRLQERLLRAQRLESVGCMASSVAHDFNNVLFAIEAGCELLDQQPLTDTELELVSGIRRAGESGRGLVARLLSFAREHDRRTCDLDLSALVRGAQPLLHRLLPRQVELKLCLGAERGLIRGDATQIDQVLLNLVANAAHAIHGRGQVVVSTAVRTLDQAEASRAELAPGTYLALSVEDTGSGIDPGVLPHIFEPFFTTKGQEGSGLGLATVHKIVCDMGGGIAVSSECGRGTTFTLYFPPADAERSRRSLRPSISTAPARPVGSVA